MDVEIRAFVLNDIPEMIASGMKSFGEERLSQQAQV